MIDSPASPVAPLTPARDSTRDASTPIARPSSSALPSAESAPAPAAVPGPSVPQPVAAATDVHFEPPILRQKCQLETPAGHRGGTVELELRVNEAGSVNEFRFTGGDADTALIRAALDCVRGMRFYPALRGGVPVAAWCEQRFTFQKGPSASAKH